SYPHECIGIITTNGKQLFYYPLNNTQNEVHKKEPEKYPWKAEIAYTVDRIEFDKLIKEVSKQGEKLIAFYHSHPDHEAYFSEIDKEAQTVFGEPEFPDAIHIVISIRMGIPNNIRCYQWNKNTYDFDEIKTYLFRI
ncbi:MAG: Mov34/MPN/PAD-1 family protein, partial [Candidatus Magnetoovum sp. WYHC-5]|nr:Mov34/MPN/PAD-1 family protein [Candidatus Magnetoovum sp. WYHC-5]